MSTKGDIYEDAHSHLLHNNSRLETTRVPTDSKMDHKLWYVHAIKESTAVKRDRSGTHAAIWASQTAECCVEGVRHKKARVV